jgi:uncharacterized membrane protein YfcA
VDPRLALIGLFVGFVVGLTGVGGSSLMTPIMIIFLGIKPLIAVGTDLAYLVPTKLLGAWVHHRQGTVDTRVVLYLSLGGLPAAVLGLLVLAELRVHLGLSALNSALKHGVGLLLFLVAAVLLATPLLRQRSARPAELSWTRGLIWSTVALGALVGFLVSITSIGSGSITVPLLYLLVPRLGLQRLVGSDVAFAALLVIVAAFGHFQMGNVNLGLAANLLVGSLPGVYLGSKLCARLPETWLRPTLAGVLVFAGSRLV